MQYRRLVLPALAVILAACADDTIAPDRVNVTPQAIQFTGPFWGSAVAAGGQHSCAIADDGTLACWGSNSDGQATVSPSLGPVLQVTAGAAHTCVIKSDGLVACWGASGDQQLSIPSGLGPVKQISANGNHTCVIRANDTVTCWGDASSGQTSVPSGIGTVRQVSAGVAHTCAVKTNNLVVCWGANDLGQGSPPFSLGTVQQIAAAQTFTCAIKSDGTVACWGDSAPSISGSALHIAAGQAHACIIETDGDARCAGDSSSGQATVPHTVGTVTQLAGGEDHTCAMKSSGVVACWGGSMSGQTNVPFLTRRFAPTATFGVVPGVDSGRPFTLSFSGARVILPNDTLSAQSAGIQYRLDCGTGGGYSLQGPDTTRTCTAGAPGVQIVKGMVLDQEGDFTEYVDTVVIINGVPLAPTGVSSSVVGRIVTLDWSDNAMNEDAQIIQRRAYTAGAWTAFSQIASLLPNVETYTDASAAAGTAYQYRIRSCSEAGCGVGVSARLETEAVPSRSNSIAVRVESGTSITIDWVDSNTNETGFEVLRRTVSATSATSYVLLAQLPANRTSYVDPLAWPGEQYYYRIRPCNAAGCATPITSTRISIPATIPAAPVNATAPVESFFDGLPSWTDASSNETYFKVLRRQNIGGVWSPYAVVVTLPANSTAFHDTSTDYGTYQYRIQACNMFGCSAASVTNPTRVVPDGIAIPG